MNHENRNVSASACIIPDIHPSSTLERWRGVENSLLIGSSICRSVEISYHFLGLPDRVLLDGTPMSLLASIPPTTLSAMPLTPPGFVRRGSLSTKESIAAAPRAAVTTLAPFAPVQDPGSLRKRNAVTPPASSAARAANCHRCAISGLGDFISSL